MGIGKGIDEIAGTCAAHGEAGVAYQDGARESLGLPEDKWYVSPETYEYFKGHKSELISKYDEWQSTYAAWKSANADLAASFEDALAGKVPDLDSLIPTFEAGKMIATRNAGSTVLQPIAQSMPFYVSGSADLHGSDEYKEEVLPKAMKSKTTAVEAGVTAAWYKYADKVLGVDYFGLSAPGPQVFEEKGMTV